MRYFRVDLDPHIAALFTNRAIVRRRGLPHRHDYPTCGCGAVFRRGKHGQWIRDRRVAIDSQQANPADPDRVVGDGSSEPARGTSTRAGSAALDGPARHECGDAPGEGKADQAGDGAGAGPVTDRR